MRINTAEVNRLLKDKRKMRKENKGLKEKLSEQIASGSTKAAEGSYVGESVLAAEALRRTAKSFKKPQGIEKARIAKKAKEQKWQRNPLSEADKKKARSVKKARTSIMKAKADWNTARAGKKLRSMPSGVDATGDVYGEKFVKVSNVDNPLYKKIKPQYRASSIQEPVGEIRQKMLNRVIMREMVGDRGLDTHFYRKKSGTPITLSQEIAYPIHKTRTPVTMGEYVDLMKDLYARGVSGKDLHRANLAKTPEGKLYEIC